MPSLPAKRFRSHYAWLILVAGCLHCLGQYVGHVQDDKTKKPASPRAIAVLEWIGEPGKPSASRIVPITVYDNGTYQDGGLYLASPQPLAVEDGTEYVLQTAGLPQGLFDIYSGEDVQGAWFGYGVWKPMPAGPRPPKLQRSKELPKIVSDNDPDRPRFKNEAQTSGQSGNGQSTSSAGQAKGTQKAGQAPSQSGTQSSSQNDSDRPTLHKRSSTDASDTSGSSNAGTSGGSTQASDDPDRPTLHRHGDSDSDTSGSGQSTAADDPDRPHFKKSPPPNSPQAAANGAPVTSVDESDPNRPRLARGKPAQQEQELDATKLTSTPPDLQQMIAVSDAKTTEPRSWLYSWAHPEDAEKAKTALEEIARKVLADADKNSFGPATATASGSNTPTKAAATRRKVTAAKTAAPETPLTDEQFKAYELAYGSGATLVFSAKTGDGPTEKYVTLIAQPDFYGEPQVRFKSVTKAADLDLTPRMRLVDAVDTDGDGRAELVFELRGKSDRQFAIYRVSGERALQSFSTGPLPYGTAGHNEAKAN